MCTSDTSVQVTTQIPDTDQTLTDRVTSSSSAYDTTSSPIESARGSGGIAAAIVIVVLVVIVLTGIAVAVAILFVIRWRKKSASEPQDAIQHGTVKGIGMSLVKSVIMYLNKIPWLACAKDVL